MLVALFQMFLICQNTLKMFFLCLKNVGKYIVWLSYSDNKTNLSIFFISLGLERGPSWIIAECGFISWTFVFL